MLLSSLKWLILTVFIIRILFEPTEKKLKNLENLPFRVTAQFLLPKFYPRILRSLKFQLYE